MRGHKDLAEIRVHTSDEVHLFFWIGRVSWCRVGDIGRGTFLDQTCDYRRACTVQGHKLSPIFNQFTFILELLARRNQTQGSMRPLLIDILEVDELDQMFVRVQIMLLFIIPLLKLLEIFIVIDPLRYCFSQICINFLPVHLP